MASTNRRSLKKKITKERDETTNTYTIQNQENADEGQRLSNERFCFISNFNKFLLQCQKTECINLTKEKKAVNNAHYTHISKCPKLGTNEKCTFCDDAKGAYTIHHLKHKCSNKNCKILGCKERKNNEKSDSKEIIQERLGLKHRQQNQRHSTESKKDTKGKHHRQMERRRVETKRYIWIAISMAVVNFACKCIALISFCLAAPLLFTWILIIIPLFISGLLTCCHRKHGKCLILTIWGTVIYVIGIAVLIVFADANCHRQYKILDALFKESLWPRNLANYSVVNSK